ncbi:MAG: class I SAM-dependent DNA methyltransferase [Bacteroidales bacterium]|nr:class I SAM-dependent DNA methyltransferase [Bacteroidales bacterium]
MAKKKAKDVGDLLSEPKTESQIKMENAQDLYNFLFEACNILRGPVSQDNFKDYITPILYYKRISDVYDEETQSALEESGGDKEYAALPEQHRFDIPEGCHWKDIRERTENLGAAIVGAMRGIELANPDTLYGVLSMFSSQKWTNKQNLTDGKIRDLIEHLSTRKLGNKDYPADLMGDAYEILLKKFADDSKAQAGEFYTPRSVVQLLIRILDPKPGESVYDPACGSGGMLIEAVHHMNHSNLCCGKIFGQEKNVTNAAIAKMNLFLHGAADFNIMQGDTLREPKILAGGELAKFDCVIANPPFSLEKWGSVEWSSDKFGRNIWGTPSDSCGDYAWIQHMIKSMGPGNSRMAVVMPQGILFRGNEEGNIRKKLVESDKVEAVVTLGDKLFYGTGLSPCFLIIRNLKPAEHSARILMIDATKILTQKRAQNLLSQEDVDRIFQLYTDYKDVEDYAKVVTLDDVKAKEYNLSPNRYVDYHKEEVKPYAEVLAEFKAAIQAVKDAEAEFIRIMQEES